MTETIELVGYGKLDGQRIAVQYPETYFTIPVRLPLPRGPEGGCAAYVMATLYFKRRRDERGPDGQVYYDFEQMIP